MHHKGSDMKKEHIALMQLEQALNNFSAVISEEEDRVGDPERWFGYWDEVLVKLIDHRILAKQSYSAIDKDFDWDAARKALSK
jgi:hypothetical protein